jgi:formylglycine-generating enzyme required for sulfatase activity
MSGNVWEWTRSLWGKGWDKPDFRYPYDPDDRRCEDLSAPDSILRVLRGGAFDNYPLFVRCACRDRFGPGLRFSRFGFRVVVSPFFSER